MLIVHGLLLIFLSEWLLYVVDYMVYYNSLVITNIGLIIWISDYKSKSLSEIASNTLNMHAVL